MPSITVGTSAVQLGDYPAWRGVQLVVDPANSGVIAWGLANTVTVRAADVTDGLIIPVAGMFVPPDQLASKNAEDIWVIASAAAQELTYKADGTVQ